MRVTRHRTRKSILFFNGTLVPYTCTYIWCILMTKFSPRKEEERVPYEGASTTKHLLRLISLRWWYSCWPFPFPPPLHRRFEPSKPMPPRHTHTWRKHRLYTYTLYGTRQIEVHIVCKLSCLEAQVMLYSGRYNFYIYVIYVYGVPGMLMCKLWWKLWCTLRVLIVVLYVHTSMYT